MPFPLSDHFDGQRFFNPSGANGRGFSQVLKYFREPKAAWPEFVAITQQQPPARAGDEVTVTFIGHATFLIQTPAGNIITDPVFSPRAGPGFGVGPKRVRNPGIRIDDLPKIDLLLLSHNHYDHCDSNSLRKIIATHKPQCITTLGNAARLAAYGAERVSEHDWWDRTEWNGNAVTTLPAQHFSARFPWDRNRTLWGGFAIELPQGRLYFAGDSGYGAHFREIGERAGPFDLALLPIGAYLPRWFMRDIHADPEEAVRAHIDVKSRLSIGMHWGTFQLTTEGIDDPVTGLRHAQAKLGVEHEAFRVLECGVTYTLPSR